MAKLKTKCEWKCDHCHKPIADGEGYVWISPIEVMEFQDAAASRPGELSITDPRILDEIPPRWQITHAACDPSDAGNSGTAYWIDVEKLRTPEDAVEWTTHLWEKTWFPATAWDAVLLQFQELD